MYPVQHYLLATPRLAILLLLRRLLPTAVVVRWVVLPGLHVADNLHVELRDITALMTERWEQTGLAPEKTGKPIASNSFLIYPGLLDSCLPGTSTMVKSTARNRK